MKLQFNPSTGKLSYNTATGKIQAVSTVIDKNCHCWGDTSPSQLKVTLAGLVGCPGKGTDLLMNGEYILDYDTEYDGCRWIFQVGVPGQLKNVTVKTDGIGVDRVTANWQTGIQLPSQFTRFFVVSSCTADPWVLTNQNVCTTANVGAIDGTATVEALF